ncbi:DNA primase [Borreliella finlandensis]|uniref:DNA primase n=1 Tax=Borreliella finlandensis TaxID=498741 RepID=A0A826H3I9_9SPIR|nr:DNA primase [Borreliella finlandensis]EEH01073.1 DNA primase [Borreliella finlandensis]
MKYLQTVASMKSKFDIVAIVEQYIKLVKSGSAYKGLCPFHAEKTPSFFVNPLQGYFYCFGCKKGGDVIGFLMDMEKINYNDALKILCEKSGIHYDDLKISRGSENKNENKDMVSKIYSLNSRLINTIKFFLSKNKKALDYVLKSRAISKEIVDLFELGYLPFNFKNGLELHDFLVSKGYSSEVLRKSGLFSKTNPKVSILFQRLIFPIKDFKGNVVGFGGRDLDGKGSKYINLGETEVFKKRELLYGFYEGLEEIKSTKSVILVEGYIDVLAFFTSGIKRAVSTLGTAFSKEHLALIQRYADEIIFSFDGDDAGLSATLKAYQICLPFNINVSVVRMDFGSDPADVLKSEGVDFLQKILNNRCDAFEYLLDVYSNKYDLNKTVDLNAMINLFLNLINLSKVDTQKKIFLDKLSNKLGIGVTTLLKDYYRIKERFVVDNNKRNLYAHNDDSYERYLIVALLKNFSYFSIVRRNIIDSDLINVDARKVFMCFENLFENNKDFSLMDLKKKLKDTYKVSEIFFEEILNSEFEVDDEMLIHILLAIKRRKLDSRVLLCKKRYEGDSLVNAKIQINELMFLNMQRKNLKIYIDDVPGS